MNSYLTPRDIGSLGYGQLVFQHGVEHVESGLFFLVQRQVLHQTDIFAWTVNY